MPWVRFLAASGNGYAGARTFEAQTADPIRHGFHFITCNAPKCF